MYNNSTPSYPQDYGNYPYPYAYAYYGYQTQQQPPGDGYQQQTDWSQAQGMQAGYPTQPQPPLPPTEPKKEVVQEIQQQKATLTKQREDYVKKAMVLRRELEELKQQKQGLSGNEKSGRELRYVLKENERLQDEINSKLKAIINVIEMLSSIIKDGKKMSDLELEVEQQETKPDVGSHTPKTEPQDRFGSPGYSRSEKELDDGTHQRHCYVYYDTGLHWCRACDKFPETAKEFLQHLHSDRHQDRAKENEVDTTPWHKLPMEELMPSYEDAPKKRIPIKGLQFFISAPSWYCKLCDIWIGDLHCASHHLKSQTHFQNYENFVKQNPHWETEWLKDREIAMNRREKRGSDSTDSDKKKRRRRRSSNEAFLKEKKKKKRAKKKKKKEESSDSSSSSSSSSDSSTEDEEDENDNDEDKGKSIRVTMRNMQQVKSIMDEDMSKWSLLEKLMQDVRKKEEEVKEKPVEDEVINQWMTISNPVPETEKNLLESLKDRMKAKQELEKAKIMEVEKRRKEKEREEEEMYEKKRKQEQEEAERIERERKRKEDEMNRVLDKERSHVRFKASREHVRKRRSSDEDDNRNHRERSSHRDDYKRNSRPESPQFRPRKSSKPESPEPRQREDSSKKRPPGPPSYKKLPFIGRMPLFKKRGLDSKGEKEKEIKVEEYEPRRKTRFESGNLTRAYIPKPDVVCFPVLSSIPPITAPPEPTAVEQVTMSMPPPAEIRQEPPPPAKKVKKEPPPPPLPPPVPAPAMEEQRQENNYNNHNHSSSEIENAYYPMYSSTGYDTARHPPLEPPPLPPDDDLAMLGICADDIGAQSF